MSRWLDPFNAAAALIFLALFVALPALGYVFIVIDFRAYLRSLRRGLVRVFQYATGDPEWYRPLVPVFLNAFDLGSQCTEEELKQAYFERIKVLHPDRGGDKQKFLRLQKHFEQALEFVRANRPGASPPANRQPSPGAGGVEPNSAAEGASRTSPS